MEVKNEPVDREYNEEGHPPDDGWYHVPIVQPEAMDTFEGAFLRIKSEYQTDIGQPICRKEVALGECAVNSKVSENGEESTSFASELKCQIPAGHHSASSLRPLFDYSQNTSQISFLDIEIDGKNVKKEDLGHRPVVVVINLQKKVFHERNFVCSICLQLFSSLDSLSLHQNDQHISMLSPNSNSSQFDDCGFESADSIVLKQHKFKHSNRKLFKSQNLNMNKLSQIGKNSFDRGQYSFKSASPSIFSNVSLTGERPFECDQCDLKFLWKSHFDIHKLSHTGKKPYECEQHTFKPAQKSNFNTLKPSQTGRKSFECDQCDYKSARKSNLITHKLSHTGEKPFECDLCDYRSATRSNVNQHKLLHTGVKPFECDQCDYKSAQKSTLNTHKLLHTGKKPFECDQCDYKSARLSTINTHKLSHTGEKQFECDRCDSKFSHKSTLNTHKLSHTGEKPFTCDQCDYRSATRSNVNTHKLSHTGERPFKCDQCDYKTARKSALNRHSLRHTGEKPNYTHKSQI